MVITTHTMAVKINANIAVTGREYPFILIFRGSLNGRGSNGSLILSVIIEAWEKVNASREPKAYRAPTFSNAVDEKKPGIKRSIPIMPNNIIETKGV